MIPTEPTTPQVAELAAQNPAFQFLAAPAEDLYSLQDGQPV